MVGRAAPSAVLFRSLHELLVQLPLLRDGDETAIHQARVAIRRLREAASLDERDDGDDMSDAQQRLARAFKAIGRARDADIAQHLVEQVEARFPLAPATIGQLRASVATSRLKSRRNMIKTLEEVDVDLIPAQLVRSLRATPRTSILSGRWRRRLRSHIARRAGEMRVAIDHASGVYFRNRSHTARVTIKKLRYALELGTATGTLTVRRGLKVLRRAQDALGEAHDREVLLERMQGLDHAGVSVNKAEVSALEQFIVSEIHTAHARYLSLRSDLLDVCAACERVPRPAMRRRAIAVASVAVPAMILWRHTRHVAQHAVPVSHNTDGGVAAMKEYQCL
jgi:CHAD domain-containing protein